MKNPWETTYYYNVLDFVKFGNSFGVRSTILKVAIRNRYLWTQYNIYRMLTTVVKHAQTVWRPLRHFVEKKIMNERASICYRCRCTTTAKTTILTTTTTCEDGTDRQIETVSVFLIRTHIIFSLSADISIRLKNPSTEK